MAYLYPKSERGGYPGLGLGVIGSDVVDLGVVYFASSRALHSVFKGHNKMHGLNPNL